MTVDLHYYARNEGTSDIQDMRGEFQLNRNVKKEMRFSSTIQHSSDFPPTLLDARRYESIVHYFRVTRAHNLHHACSH